MEEYFIRVQPDGRASGVWRITERTAEMLGFSRDVPGTHFEARAGENAWDAMRREASSWFHAGEPLGFHRIALLPGQYYPRIARPDDQYQSPAPGLSPSALIENDRIAMARGQMNALTRQLDRLFQTIHPAADNLEVYGHDIRNLLILACTEVEMHWRGVLTANGVIKPRYTTKDYVVLARAMKLNEYRIGMLPCPWLEPSAPFENWGDTNKPTQELPWFDAYNAVKHNREAEFPKASFRSAIDAVSACYAMIAAQYGGAVINHQSEIQSFFELRVAPVWQPGEVYVQPYGMIPYAWTPMNYPFSGP